MKPGKSNVPIASLCLISLSLLFVFTNPSSGHAVTIDSFGEPFYVVLDNLMTNYWPPEGNGNWMYDEIGSSSDYCGGYDAPQFSAELLYPLGVDMEEPLYIHRANRTVEYVIGITNLLEILEKFLNGESIMEEGASLPTLLYGHRHYSGDSPYPFDTELPLFCNLATSLVRGGETFGMFNGYSGAGAVAYYDLILAYNFRDQGSTRRAAHMARQAYGLLEAADAYWVQETEGSGYYHDPVHHNYMWDSAQILEALALAYQASSNELYLNRAQDLFNWMEAYWDPMPPYGYRFFFSGLWYKVLSDNHLMAKALLILYDATADPFWLERASQTLIFMTDPVILVQDPRFQEYSIIAHDCFGFPESDTDHCSCSGCNFAVLAAIYMYNRLEQEGPSGLDILPTCMIATSAFGSSMRGKTHVLRAFRDSYLTNHPAGRAFVKTYYECSPPIADSIARHGWIRKLVRILLLPVVGIVSLFV